jgi:DNA/RNA-binding domain of Phe-tRNA-synthetase-like protein
MIEVGATQEWATHHPGATIGILELSSAGSAGRSAGLEARKRQTESFLRETYHGASRQDLLALPVLSAYRDYYKRFSKTYHVQLQLESIISKGKSLPDVSPLVDAYFMAEMRTLVLTAAHDADRLEGDVRIDVSRAGDTLLQMNGAVKEIRPGDMVMRADGNVVCSIIYGQDRDTAISATTTHVLYVAYAPVGVATKVVEALLGEIEDAVRLFAPAAVTEQRRLVTA